MRIALLLILAAACRTAVPEERAIRTTDGALALANLDVQIAGQEQLLRREPASASTAAALVELLQARAQYSGRISDYDRAAETAARAVRLSPGSPVALLARASSRAALHLFAQSLEDVDAAQRSGADASGLRASVLQAQGQVAAAVALRRAAVRQYANTQTLGALAAAEGAQGDSAAAERDFDRAVRVYRDTSPLPLAWIDFQRGLLRERTGDLIGARAAYSAALARLPAYAQAAAHLAAIDALEGHRDHAAQRLRPLAGLEDPEYRGQLAGLVPDPERTALRRSAKESYEALLALHPEAFADHAARFFLPFDARRALLLAKRNLEARQSWDAWELVLQAASAAGEDECALARKAAALPDPPARIRLVANRCSGTALR